LIIEDIFPTFLQMANLEEEAKKSLDGISFLPLLKGKGVYEKERPIYWHYPNTYDQPPYSAIRKGDWKLIYHHVNQKLELFNLKEDIGESTNLFTERIRKSEELARQLSSYLIEVKAQMPIDKITKERVSYPVAVLK
jgi:arylsulfatase A-like enzyme